MVPSRQTASCTASRTGAPSADRPGPDGDEHVGAPDELEVLDLALYVTFFPPLYLADGGVAQRYYREQHDLERPPELLGHRVGYPTTSKHVRS